MFHDISLLISTIIWLPLMFHDILLLIITIIWLSLMFDHVLLLIITIIWLPVLFDWLYITINHYHYLVIIDLWLYVTINNIDYHETTINISLPLSMLSNINMHLKFINIIDWSLQRSHIEIVPCCRCRMVTTENDRPTPPKKTTVSSRSVIFTARSLSGKALTLTLAESVLRTGKSP